MRILIALALVACSARTESSAPTAPAARSTPATPPAADPAPAGTFGGRARWEPLPSEPFLVDHVRANESMRCAVSRAGRVACWGKFEQESDSPLEMRDGVATPLLLAGVTDAIDVATDWFYVCVAQRTGAGGCFVTANIGRPAPTFPVPPVELAPGHGGICARLRDGTVGCVDLDGKYAAIAGIRDATELACARETCCAITATGVRCFGDERPELGIAKSTSATPIGIKLPAATAIAFDHDAACVRTKVGGAHCWGAAKALSQPAGVRGVAAVDIGLCVIRDDGTTHCSDDRTPASTHVVQAEDSCVVHADGSASCYGFNEDGELGDGHIMLSPTPVQVPKLDDVVDLRVAHASACAVRKNGELVCWGEGGVVDLGTAGGPLIPGQYLAACRIAGTSVRCSVPTLGGDWESESFVTAASSIKSAAIHRDTSVCVVDGAGKVTCRHGMSEGGVDSRWVPLAAAAPVEEIQPLGVGFCARHRDGRVSCFVDHRYDNDDDFLDKLPNGKLTLVPGITDATQLATGQDEACVVTKGATVWCWNADAPKPIERTTLRGATALGANHLHACAVVRGEVWCWGDNFLGQLGTGTGGTRIDAVKTPVRASTSFTAVRVGTGRSATCALDDKGKVWCWGSNKRGELGQPRPLKSDALSKVVGLGPR